MFSNLVANDYKSHVVVNGLVTFWLISTSVNDQKIIKIICKTFRPLVIVWPQTPISSMKIVFTKLTNIRIIFKIVPNVIFLYIFSLDLSIIYDFKFHIFVCPNWKDTFGFNYISKDALFDFHFFQKIFDFS